jgi:hypothetical protein
VVSGYYTSLQTDRPSLEPAGDKRGPRRRRHTVTLTSVGIGVLVPAALRCILFRFPNSSLNSTMPYLDFRVWSPNLLCKIPILRHIKILAHIWSTKYRRNKKLIAQFCYTLGDEYFKPN